MKTFKEFLGESMLKVKSTRVSHKVYKVEVGGDVFRIDGATGEENGSGRWTLYKVEKHGVDEPLETYRSKREAMAGIPYNDYIKK